MAERTGRRATALLALAAASAVSMCLGACSGSSSSTTSTLSRSPHSVTLLMGDAPDSLDPGKGYTPQAAEADWLAYTGLLTYAHGAGAAGTELIPGLATALPQISADGKTYTLTLRKGLIYSDGRPVHARDFVWTVERALKLPWGGSRHFIAGQIQGAGAFADGRSQTISGIAADDLSGQITIRLKAPYGAFENVLALPALGLVPSGTPFRDERHAPPPGVGPYVLTHVMSDGSFSGARNPYWPRMHLGAVPAGRLDVKVRISGDVGANALAVLDGAADVLDWTDTIPTKAVAQIQARAPRRYATQVMNSTYYIFMDTAAKPFSSQLARAAVVTAVDQKRMNRLAGGTLVPGCYLLPPGMAGHPTTPCPYADPNSGGELTAAKSLVKRSGMAGTHVTVWSGNWPLHQRWMAYYTALLRQLGFKARLKVIDEASYFSKVGELRLNAQTGFADWYQDFPNPLDFYALLSGRAIVPVGNPNLSRVEDPHIDNRVAPGGSLYEVPQARLGSVAGQWGALERYTAKKAYVAVFGYQTFPRFISSRMDPGALVFHRVYGLDWTSFRLK